MAGVCCQLPVQPLVCRCQSVQHAWLAAQTGLRAHNGHTTCRIASTTVHPCWTCVCCRPPSCLPPAWVCTHRCPPVCLPTCLPPARLQAILEEEELKDSVILVYANKQARAEWLTATVECDHSWHKSCVRVRCCGQPAAATASWCERAALTLLPLPPRQPLAAVLPHRQQTSVLPPAACAGPAGRPDGCTGVWLYMALPGPHRRCALKLAAQAGSARQPSHLPQPATQQTRLPGRSLLVVLCRWRRGWASHPSRTATGPSSRPRVRLIDCTAHQVQQQVPRSACLLLLCAQDRTDQTRCWLPPSAHAAIKGEGLFEVCCAALAAACGVVCAVVVRCAVLCCAVLACDFNWSWCGCLLLLSLQWPLTTAHACGDPSAQGLDWLSNTLKTKRR